MYFQRVSVVNCLSDYLKDNGIVVTNRRFVGDNEFIPLDPLTCILKRLLSKL
jgi:hypothetical protein